MSAGLIEIHLAVWPSDGTRCTVCSGSTWKDGPPLFTLKMGSLNLLLCYGCLETLSKQCDVFVFKKRRG